MINKQEALKKIEKLDALTIKDKYFNFDIEMIPKGEALEIIEQLDEPEKPVVPQYIADYIDSEQYSCSTLSEAIDNMDDEKEVLCWFYDNTETFAKAWLFGYEVKKEKLYTVELPNPNRADVSLMLGLYNDGKVAIFAAFTDSWKYEKQYKLTEAEIKEDFEWAWQFAEEVEND